MFWSVPGLFSFSCLGLSYSFIFIFSTDAKYEGGSSWHTCHSSLLQYLRPVPPPCSCQSVCWPKVVLSPPLSFSLLRPVTPFWSPVFAPHFSLPRILELIYLNWPFVLENPPPALKSQHFSNNIVLLLSSPPSFWPWQQPALVKITQP